jgi:hemerythrin superfamily protein
MNDHSNRSSSEDVIGFLKAQHQEIKSLFDQVISQSGSERLNSFAHLKRLMSVHEAAEEKIVHPAAKSAIAGGREEVAARTAEETKAKKTLAELSHLDVASPEFDAKIRSLQQAVLAHAKSEEKEEFDKLEKKLDEKTLKKMEVEVERVEAKASEGRKPN